jgi:hypothetical protein
MRASSLLLLVAISQASAQEQAHIERNVIYGMYSGLSLLMDIQYPEKPNGYGILFIAGSAFYAPLGYDDTPLKR